MVNNFRVNMADGGTGSGVAANYSVYNDVTLSDLETNIEKIARTLNDYNTSIASGITELGKVWQGDSYNAMVDVYNELKQSLDEIPTVFREYAKECGTFSVSVTNMIRNIVQIGEDGNGSRINYNGILGESSTKYVNNDYIIDENVSNAKEAINRVQDVSNTIAEDMYLLNQQRADLGLELSTIGEMYKNGYLTEAQANEYRNQINEKITVVDNAIGQYGDAQDLIYHQTEWHLFRPDGDLRSANKWFAADDMDQVHKSLDEIKATVGALPPIGTLCETSVLNSQFMVDTENYDKDAGFINHGSVSDLMLEASYNANVATGSTPKEDGNPRIKVEDRDGVKVSYYNTGDYFEDGELAYLQEGHNSISGSAYTHGERDTFMDPDAKTSDGYDSVRIEDGDNVVYMSYTDYAKSQYALEEESE